MNADAIVDYIRQRNPDKVSLVCMGYAAQYPVEEDTLCAEYIRGRLKAEKTNYNQMTETIRNRSGKRFFVAGNQGHAPSTDFYLCLDINRFNFILKALPVEPGILSLKPSYNVT